MSLGWDSHPLQLCTAQGRSCGSERSLVALAAPGVGMSQVLILVLPAPGSPKCHLGAALPALSGGWETSLCHHCLKNMDQNVAG